jgi:hypothetical protein
MGILTCPAQPPSRPATTHGHLDPGGPYPLNQDLALVAVPIETMITTIITTGQGVIGRKTHPRVVTTGVRLHHLAAARITAVWPLPPGQVQVPLRQVAVEARVARALVEHVGIRCPPPPLGFPGGRTP